MKKTTVFSHIKRIRSVLAGFLGLGAVELYGYTRRHSAGDRI
jgi:hypothetical protein